MTRIAPSHRSPAALALALFSLAGASCVTENLTTGEMVPRGNQRYPYAEVEKQATRLQDGMTKGQVLDILGSPAEIDKSDDEWIYLPERYGIIVPAHALRLKFKDGLLVEHGHQAIVLGARL
jgi:outer membrane protein assembly factor BamE (lipoprotein component of BamABCDE complex)